jgi:hypothetical protein
MTKFITISIEITVEDNVDDTKYFAFLVRGLRRAITMFC